ncbi:hypothetical protein [Streptomyces sp. H39-S7]|uniref:hypothetical protein n=1 Tax=Streptomyces sp. H39-S7 TaxID=3004357 RepID=UPI0022AEC52D|nr:hypothetical protein [Streptomyces sp. H39-S7]MCZ4121139.1 hypothetical protein [Streptomyces sp. H39-S7]
MRFVFSADDVPPPSGFDLGHLEVAGNLGSYSSRGHAPDQAMMIYVSLSLLLDGLRSLVEAGRGGYAFGGVDSSFSLKFSLTKDGTLTTQAPGTPVDRSDVRTVVAAAWAAAEGFAAAHLPGLPPDDAGRQDLEMSLAAFAPLVTRAG